MLGRKSDLLPVGTTIMFAGDLPENSNWLLCDGRPFDQNEYPELYLAIKDLYTPEPNASTFNIPKYLGTFLRGASNASDVDPDRNYRQAINPSRKEALSELGTLQHYATKIPNGAPFKANFNHLPVKSHRTHGVTSGSHTGPGSPVTKEQDTCTSGGDNESRPINIYLNMYIKGRS